MTTPWQCSCLVCAPAPAAELDDIDTRAISDVKRYGWHVLIVGAGEEVDEEPVFAYSIGMMHSLGHPEVLMSGQPSVLLHTWINTIGEQITAGHPLQVGVVREGVVDGFAVTAERVTAAARDEAVCMLRSFYRRDDVPAMQCVWASPEGHFPWQAGAPTELRRRQPARWRTPSQRVGALAVRPVWPFPVPGDHRVFTTRQIVEDRAPILLVTHEISDGQDDWQFLPGDPVLPEDVTVVHLAHLVMFRPTLRDLADLSPGWEAERESPLHPWVRSASRAEPEGQQLG